MELFSLATGVKLLHVPYKGTGPASLALIGGEVQIGFNNVQTLLQNVKAGQLRALAVAEPQRVPALPDVPTVAETVPGFTMAPWIGIIVPVKTPKEIVARLSRGDARGHARSGGHQAAERAAGDPDGDRPDRSSRSSSRRTSTAGPRSSRPRASRPSKLEIMAVPT